jgi:hypothetical protein
LGSAGLGSLLVVCRPSTPPSCQLRQIAVDGLARMYFRANNSRAHGLDVEFTDVERLDIDL